jgi:hypothetical protein
MDHPVGDLAPPSLRGADRRRAHASYRRALTAGLVVSAAVHVFVLALYPRFFPRHPVEIPIPFAPPAVTSGGGAMTAIRIKPVEEGAVETPAKPVTPKAPEQPKIAPVAPNLGGEPGVRLVSPGAAAEALRPHLTDPRIWLTVDSALTQLTLQQRLQLALSGRIEELSDSMAAAAAAHRRLTDWTFTDKNGKKWGIKDGKLIIDGFAVPIPFSFGTPVGQRDVDERNKWEWEEIQRGSAAAAVHDSWKEREKAIRERRDKERAKARADTTGGGG